MNYRRQLRMPPREQWAAKTAELYAAGLRRIEDEMADLRVLARFAERQAHRDKVNTRLPGNVIALSEVEAARVQQALAEAPSKAEAARRLGIGRNTLYGKMRKLKLG